MKTSIVIEPHLDSLIIGRRDQLAAVTRERDRADSAAAGDGYVEV